MKTLTVDDSKPIVNMVIRILTKLYPKAEHLGATEVKDALEIFGSTKIDVAFLDVEMPVVSGIELARRLQEINPKVNIIFITGHVEYMKDAFALYASGYITKPVTEEDMKGAMDHLRYLVSDESKKVRVQCFGNFEVFVDDRPVHFARSKSKELFAYLVDRRGAACTNEMMIGNLWPDQPPSENIKTNLRVTLLEMINAFSALGYENIFFRGRNSMAVDTGKLDCDYYNYLNGTNDHDIFRGEYMTQYEFAEETRAFLQNE